MKMKWLREYNPEFNIEIAYAGENCLSYREDVKKEIEKYGCENLKVVILPENLAKEVIGLREKKFLEENVAGECKDYIDSVKNFYEKSPDCYTHDEESGLLLLNIDHPEWRRGLEEGLFHHLTFQEGWLKTYEEVFSKFWNAILVSLNEFELLSTIHSSVSDLLSFAMGVEKGNKNFCESSVKTYLENTIRRNSEDELLKFREYPEASYNFLIDVTGHSTLPENFGKEREKIKKEIILPKREKLFQHLSPVVRDYEKEVDEIFWNLKIPPEKSDLNERMKELIFFYLEGLLA